MQQGYGTYGSIPASGFDVPPPTHMSGKPYPMNPTLPPSLPVDQVNGSRPPSDKSLLRVGSGSWGRTRVNIWELILVPWLLQILVLACFLQAGAVGATGALVCIPLAILTLNAWFLRHHYKAGDTSEVVLGVLCMVAILISLVVASWGVSGALSEYRRLNQGALYFGVQPSDAAAGKSDAALVQFTNSTRVDLARAFGFTDTRTAFGHTYCVAPIMDGDLFQTRVEYWAAGIDCCEARGNFDCFNVQSSKSHGGLSMDLSSKETQGFQEAVQGAQAMYRLTTSPRYLLLEWVKDPVAHRDGLWNRTAVLFSVFAGVYLVISSMVSFAVYPAITSKPQPLAPPATAPLP